MTQRRMRLFSTIHFDCSKVNTSCCTPASRTKDTCRAFWIDWHPEGNLITSCDINSAIMIFDVRTGRCEKYLHTIHNGKEISFPTNKMVQGEEIYAVKWDPTGKTLISSSNTLVKVTDMSTEKVVYGLESLVGSKYFYLKTKITSACRKYCHCFLNVTNPLKRSINEQHSQDNDN